MKQMLIAVCVAGLAACDTSTIYKQTAPQPAAQSSAGSAQAAAPQAQAAPKLDPNEVLAARVKQALERREKILAAAIDVTAVDGTVTLWGTAATAAERARAVKLASSIEGVKAVENKIAVVKGS
jgi:osmotically-inducible protein OsmY